ncbi:hypothetical protein Dimus_039655 [Dionaea muscipula]
MGMPFVIKTDHESLKHLLAQKLSTCVQMRGMSKLLGLQYRIEYKKGVENKAADALSRRHEEKLSAMMAVTPSWMEEIQRSYTTDPYAQSLIQALNSDFPKPPYSLQSGLLRHKGKMYIGAMGNLRQQLLQEHHCSPHSGHSGIEVTWRKLRESFFWPGLMSDINQFIKTCEVCQQVKPLNSTPGLLQPLPIPLQAWDSVSLDFIEGLPRSHSYDSILVVMNRLTKYTHFIPLSHPLSAPKVAQLFHDQMARLHGYPSTLISDRDKVFTSLFWGEIFRLSDTRLCMSTSYHPQTDGQTERVNRCLEDYLRCICLQGSKQWALWISAAEWWYNTHYHKSLNMTPFEALYRYPPPKLGLPVDPTTAVGTVEGEIEKRRKLSRQLHENLARAQSKQKSYADKKRREKNFKEGDIVFLRLQPYRQNTVAVRKSLKLAARYFGPYKILRRIGSVAYELELPPTALIHNMFHVSLLKGSVAAGCTSVLEPPHMNGEGHMVVEPQAILDQREITRRGRKVKQYLIQWVNLCLTDATWEDTSFINKQFPDFTA